MGGGLTLADDFVYFPQHYPHTQPTYYPRKAQSLIDDSDIKGAERLSTWRVGVRTQRAMRRWRRRNRHP